MDGARFDDWLRAIGSGITRRTTIGAALGGLFASGSLSLLGEDAEAKKKKKGKKKKKKCKGGKKKCGKTCIPADDCCGGCQGGRICDSGACSCPPETPIPCPDGGCVGEGQCCGDADCGSGLSCTEGFCVCPGQNDITCGETCCQSTEDEVCSVSVGPPTCQGGGCVANDWCNGSDFFLCANSLDAACICLSTADPTPETACVNYFDVVDAANCGATCNTSGDCPGDDVCVPGNAVPGEGFCLCDNNFCAARCDGGTERRGRERDGAKTLAGMRKKKVSR